MLFVNKFCSHLKYNNIMHFIPDIAFKSACFFNMKTFACSKSTIRTKFDICSHSTIKTIERRHWHCSSVFIVNLEQFSELILLLQLLTLKQVIPRWEG